jgi:glycerophosphoryl diester phosphodiesterase
MRYLIALVILLHASGALADPVCVAHRGNSSAHLENSRAALESALGLGAEAVELDVRHTRDGVGIVLHDATLRRTAMHQQPHRCPLDRRVGKLPAGEIITRCRLRNGERIPTLARFLETTSAAGVVVFLELKDRPSAATIALIERHFDSSPENLRLISFKAVLLAKARDQLSSLFERGARAYHITANPERLNWAFDGICVLMPTRDVVRGIVRRQKDIVVWTIDGRQGMSYYSELGVDYVVTNRIATCLDAL